MDECYVRGNMIKYIRVAEDVIDTVKQQETEARQRREAQSSRGGGGGGRGDRGGRGGESDGGVATERTVGWSRTTAAYNADWRSVLAHTSTRQAEVADEAVTVEGADEAKGGAEGDNSCGSANLLECLTGIVLGECSRFA